MTDKSRTPVILKGGVRPPIGRFLGGLSSLSAPELGAIAVRAALDRSSVDVADIDEVIMGNVVSAGAGQAPARQAAVNGGVPATVSAVTINKVCGSGLKAVMLAAQSIKLATSASSSRAAWSRCRARPSTCRVCGRA